MHACNLQPKFSQLRVAGYAKMRRNVHPPPSSRTACEPLRKVAQRSMAPCIPGKSYGCWPGEPRMWVRDRCRGGFVCGSGRERECATCSFARGCTGELSNCSCVKAAPLPEGVALQHPKPPFDAQLLRTLRFTPCPDTTSCPPQGSAAPRVFVMQGAKEDAAFGNLFFSAVSNAVLYSGHKGFVPFISFSPQV